MKLANCSRCGKVFSFVPGTRDICPSCVKIEDDNYLKVFHFMGERPTATAPEISEGTGVDIKDILRFVRENRLRLAQIEPGLNCEKCGKPLFSGKFCENCANQLASELQSESSKNKGFQHPEGPLPPPKDPKYLKDRRSR